MSAASSSAFALLLRLRCSKCRARELDQSCPSFRTTEYFATINLRAKTGIGVILHLGAKVRQLPPGGVAIEDPTRLLKWLGNDRAIVEFADAQEFNSSKAAFQAVLRQWVGLI